jgi:hypothetical protein
MRTPLSVIVSSLLVGAVLSTIYGCAKEEANSAAGEYRELKGKAVEKKGGGPKSPPPLPPPPVHAN